MKDWTINGGEALTIDLGVEYRQLEIELERSNDDFLFIHAKYKALQEENKRLRNSLQDYVNYYDGRLGMLFSENELVRKAKAALTKGLGHD